MDGRPQIKRVSLESAVGVEALEGVLAQIDREGAVRCAGLAVHGAGTTALLAAASQTGQVTQMGKYLFDHDMLAQERVVNLGSGLRADLCRRLDGRAHGPYGRRS